MSVRRAKTLVLLSGILLLFSAVSCREGNGSKVTGRHAVVALMNSAELIMNDNPERACQLMDSIDSHSIRSRALQARYALLYTESRYKNYIDETNDSLIMIAVRYYSIGNDYLSRFRSYYSLGCIYNGLHRYTDAAVALSEAERLESYIDDGYRLGLLYSQLGDVFSSSFDYHRAEQYYTKAYYSYLESAKEMHSIYALSDIAGCYMNLHQFKEGDSILYIVEKWALRYDDAQLYSNTLMNRLSCSLYMNDADSSKMLFDKYNASFGIFKEEPFSLNLLSRYCLFFQDIDQARDAMNKMRNTQMTLSDSVNLYFLSSTLANCQGNQDSALYYYQESMALQNKNLRTSLQQPVLGAQKDHFRTLAELESLKSKHSKTILFLCIIIFVFILIIAVIYYYFKHKRMQEQLYDSLATIEELTAANHISTDKIVRLRSEILRQFQERHDVSNHLYSMYFGSNYHDKITKQQLNTLIERLIKEYTSQEYIRNLDKLINESCNDIMKRLSAPEIGLTEKDIQLLRFSISGLSLKSFSFITKESVENVYQIKTRLMKKIKAYSYDLWDELHKVL